MENANISDLIRLLEENEETSRRSTALIAKLKADKHRLKDKNYELIRQMAIQNQRNETIRQCALEVNKFASNLQTVVSNILSPQKRVQSSNIVELKQNRKPVTPKPDNQVVERADQVVVSSGSSGSTVKSVSAEPQIMVEPKPLIVKPKTANQSVELDDEDAVRQIRTAGFSQESAIAKPKTANQFVDNEATVSHIKTVKPVSAESSNFQRETVIMCCKTNNQVAVQPLSAAEPTVAKRPSLNRIEFTPVLATKNNATVVDTVSVVPVEASNSVQEMVSTVNENVTKRKSEKKVAVAVNKPIKIETGSLAMNMQSFVKLNRCDLDQVRVENVKKMEKNGNAEKVIADVKPSSSGKAIKRKVDLDVSSNTKQARFTRSTAKTLERNESSGQGSIPKIAQSSTDGKKKTRIENLSKATRSSPRSVMAKKDTKGDTADQSTSEQNTSARTSIFRPASKRVTSRRTTTFT